MPAIATAAGRIFYAALGQAGPAMLCLHGAGGSHSHWGPLMALGDQARLIAPDLPGHGRSAPPGRDSIAAYAAAALALLDALQIERALLLGHSMGAAVALTLALTAPGRVAGLALLGASARLRVLPALIRDLGERPDDAIDLLVSMLYANNVPAERLAAAAADFRSCDPLVIRGDFLACDGFDIRPQLGAIGQPALILAGDDDRLTPPRLAQELRAGLPNARLEPIGACGHMPMVERPAAVEAALRAWLAALPAA